MFSHRSSSLVGLVILAALLLTALPVLAHEEITVGPYRLEVGWLDEPPLVGLKNALFLSVEDEETGEPVEDIGDLTVTINAGGSGKELLIRPLGEATPGQFAGDFIPTRRGVYTVKLTGKIRETDIDVSQDIEEVEDVASIQFPEAPSDPLESNRGVEEAKAAASSAQTLAVIGIVVGAAGVLIGLLGRRR